MIALGQYTDFSVREEICFGQSFDIVVVIKKITLKCFSHTALAYFLMVFNEWKACYIHIYIYIYISTRECLVVVKYHQFPALLARSLFKIVVA